MRFFSLFLIGSLILSCASVTPPPPVSQSAPESKSVKELPLVEMFPFGEELFALAEHQNKVIILFFYSNGCSWCTAMKKNTFNDPETAVLMNKHFLLSGINVEEQREIAQELLGTRIALPSTLFILPDGVPVPVIIEGYASPEEFKKILNLLAEHVQD